jgi:hypothetical protein
MVIVQKRISPPNLTRTDLGECLASFIPTRRWLLELVSQVTSCHFRPQAAFSPTPPCSQEPSDCSASIGGGRFFCTTQSGAIAEIGNCYGPSPLLPFDGFHNLKIYTAIFHEEDTRENSRRFAISTVYTIRESLRPPAASERHPHNGSPRVAQGQMEPQQAVAVYQK